MPDGLLKLTPVSTAGDYVRACWHIYYGAYYVGIIRPCSGNAWRAWLHGMTLGEFGSLDEAKGAVREWYYGPAATADLSY
jgi:hypothetical protein